MAAAQRGSAARGNGAGLLPSARAMPSQLMMYKRKHHTPSRATSKCYSVCVGYRLQPRSTNSRATYAVLGSQSRSSCQTISNRRAMHYNTGYTLLSSSLHQTLRPITLKMYPIFTRSSTHKSEAESIEAAGFVCAVQKQHLLVATPVVDRNQTRKRSQLCPPTYIINRLGVSAPSFS